MEKKILTEIDVKKEDFDNLLDFEAELIAQMELLGIDTFEVDGVTYELVYEVEGDDLPDEYKDSVTVEVVPEDIVEEYL